MNTVSLGGGGGDSVKKNVENGDHWSIGVGRGGGGGGRGGQASNNLRGGGEGQHTLWPQIIHLHFPSISM